MIGEFFLESVFAGVTLSLVSYMAGVALKKKFKTGWFNPLLISIAISILVLVVGHIDYVVCGLLAGAITSLTTVFLLSKLFGLSHKEYVTLLPKSITTAIGMGVSEELGGYVTITVAVIIITGVLGNMFGEFVCKIFKITEPISKGLAFGASAHAIGTTKAMELGEVEGAMSGLAIAVSGIFTVALSSLFAGLM